MAFLHVLFCLLSFYTFPSFGHYKAICSPEDSLMAKIYNLKMFNTKIEIGYNIDSIHVDNFPASNMELLINSANVLFTASVVPNSLNKGLNVHVNFNPKFVTINRGYELINGKNNSYCKLNLLEEQNISMGLPREVESAILDLTKDCIHKRVCEEFDSMISDDFLQKSLQNNTAIKKTEFSCVDKATDTAYNPQKTINAMADFGVAVIIKRFVLNGNTTLEIPDISAQFSTGSSFWKTTGDFTASKGLFDGLEKLKRTSDVIFRNENNQFSVDTTYQLENSRLTFGYYKVRYGKLSIDGILSVLIEEIIVKAALEFDYNNSVCQIRLTTFDVAIKTFDVNLTGFGYLNTPASKFVSWIIKKKLYTALKDTIADTVSNLDCEKFRP